MSRRGWFWLGGGGLVAAVVVIGLVQSGGSTKAPTPDAFDLSAAQAKLKGAPAQLASLHADASKLIPADTGKYSTTISALKGHPVVVNKWASWCGPCRGEFPVLQSTSTQFGKQVAFVGLDASDNDADAGKFLKHFPVPYPSLVDRNSRIAQSLGIGRSFPTTLYYGADGKVKYIHQGPYTSDSAFATDIKRYALGQPR
jgi:cytochrome c biogenesis protein CcmG/thiol:disulfide interchange protein DsbE